MHQQHKPNNSFLPGTMLNHCARLRVLFSFVVVTILYFVLLSPALAQSYDSANNLIEYLEQEKTQLTIIYNDLKEFTDPVDITNYESRNSQLNALFTVNRVKIANFKNILADQKKEKHQLTQRLKKLQQSSTAKEGELNIQDEVVKVNSLIKVNNKVIELINENLLLAQRLHESLLNKLNQFALWKAETDLNIQLAQFSERIEQLQETKANLYQENIAFQAERKSDISLDNTINFESKLLLNNQRIFLVQTKIAEFEQQKKQLKAEFMLLKNQDVKSIEQLITIYQDSIHQFSMLINSLKKLQTLVDDEQIQRSDQSFQSQYSALQDAVTKRIYEIDLQIKTLNTKLNKTQQQFKNQFSLRKGLAEYNLQSWPSIAQEFIQIPLKFYGYLKTLSIQFLDNYTWQDTWPLVFYWASIFAILIAAVALNLFLEKIMQEKIRLRLSGHLYDWLLVLIKRNIPQFTIVLLMMTSFYLNDIALSNYRLLLNLLLVWLVFRNLILSARLLLLERLTDVSGKDVKLYYRLKWLLLAGGWSTALMVFSHQYPLSLLMQDIFNRLLMLYFLALAIVIWKSKDIIPYLLRPILKAKKRYIRNATVLLISLIPITLFTTAIIGLIGYVNLAWIMSKYQGYLLVVITAYVLVRGLIADFLELLSEWMISSLRNGWLWIEVILKPLDKILRLLLLLLSFITLFELFGWYYDSWIMTRLKIIGTYPFVNLSGIHITLLSVFQFILLFFIFLWAAKWTREFCYRWLYRNSRDAGIRNSLSAFTQYGVIVIGAFITLRVLGLDFSGMSMILGGLAVGMGFGLRDFASNIIGGIMLLIERPVREGDLITIGEHEGRVAHIGIRSMRVSSWDNMEVLVPNAETFNKPFTNWTHQDNIVRSVIPIKISRSDDPLTIQQLILDVLAIIPEILDTPPSQVFLKHIDDALIEFETRYYINVQEHSLFEVRSKVLFAITAQFKATGIKPPIPPLSIEFKENEQCPNKPIKE